jgi:predicted nuclease of predicted toxin-antitoxin system
VASDCVKLFVDENLSPTLVVPAHTRGYNATCSRDRDMLGLSDRELLEICIDEERVLVSENEGDFRTLCASAGVHPGLIVLPSTTREEEHRLLDLCLVHIEAAASRASEQPADYMLNRVVEIDLSGEVIDRASLASIMPARQETRDARTPAARRPARDRGHFRLGASGAPIVPPGPNRSVVGTPPRRP